MFHKEQPRQGDLILFRWTGFHSVVQVHDVLQEKPIPGGITSGAKTECVGGPNYSCANAPPIAGEYLIDTEDYRPGILRFSDEDAIHNPTIKECWNGICSGMNQEFQLEYRKPTPPPDPRTRRAVLVPRPDGGEAGRGPGGAREEPLRPRLRCQVVPVRPR